MNTLRTASLHTRAFTLIALAGSLLSGTAGTAGAADHATAGPVATTDTVTVLPPVIVLGKRLSALEKSRLAQTGKPDYKVASGNKI